MSEISFQWFNRVVVGSVATGFIALVVAGLFAAWTMIEIEDHTRWVNHTYEVERSISSFQILAERMETARRGYLLTGDERFLQTFDDTALAISPAVEQIQKRVADNPKQRDRAAALKVLVDNQLTLLRVSNARLHSGQSDAALKAFRGDGSVDANRDLRAIGNKMVSEENRLLAIRDAQQQSSLRNFYVVLAVAGILLIIVAGGSLLVILQYTRDLTRSRNTLRSMNDNLEQAVEERTADLQRANDEIQRFAYIVSHDLRSPLVNVMGFTAELETATQPLAELVSRVSENQPDLLTEDARVAAQEDLPEAINFIRSSTQKMDRLINAILRLSREGRRVLMPEPLDMAALLQGIIESLSFKATELGAEIRIETPLPKIVSDRVAVEQIFSNLIENSLKYLSFKRPGIITVRGSSVAGRIVFEVEDNGRGIDPKDHERVFDLFRRSGQQDQPGEGIGLAHVRALVYRLGGLISCRSALDAGATFVVSLPATIGSEGGMSQ